MKSMVFIDYQNFDISLRKYLSSQEETFFNINYSKLSMLLNSKIKLNTTMMKTFLFAYKPCETLMKIPHYEGYYNWLSGMKSKSLFEVVEGTQEIRQVSKGIPIDINNPSTYTTEEKGTWRIYVEYISIR